MLKKKFHLTKSGLKKIKREYNDLKKVKFPKAMKELAHFSRANSADTDTIPFWENLNFIKARIIELKNILSNVELIKKPPKSKRNVVDLGSVITLMEKDGQTSKFMMVEALEVSPDDGKISPNSPVGKTLLGRVLGDEIKIVSLNNETFKIIEIKY